MKPLTDGRDEMNLAEFPISVLQRQQPKTAAGDKRDSVAYEASRYDPASRQRMQQRVVLESNSRHGLPTPADENVVLALLYIAKHTHHFTDPVVPFSPRQLFRIMGWAPNSRSYDRLRAVLRRLKALVIRYENSWWDIEGRAYEAEFATGIISEYEIGRAVGGKGDRETASRNWVRWTPHFQQSLSKGNLKKLDLEQLFALRFPTSQRMYRFLDKRFYPRHRPPAVEMDLHDFACGHIGLAPVANVAEIKRRLAPAIDELEAIGFIASADPAQRYFKVGVGVWRIRFQAGPRFQTLPSDLPTPQTPIPKIEAEESKLVAAFYRAWNGQTGIPLGGKDGQQARALLQSQGPIRAQALIPLLVEIVRRKWPECKSFSGAVTQYLEEALQVQQQRQCRAEHQQQARFCQEAERQEWAHQQEVLRQREAHWHTLSETDRRVIEQAVRDQYPEHQNRPAILQRLCLDCIDRLDELKKSENRFDNEHVRAAQ